jgi:hypothetical protein
VRGSLAVHSSSPVRALEDRGRGEGGGERGGGGRGQNGHRHARSLSPRDVAEGAARAQEGGAGGGGLSALAVKDKVLDTIVRYELESPIYSYLM